MSIGNISSPFELSSSSSSPIVEKPRCKPIPNVPDELQNIEKILRNKNTLTSTEADLFFEEISKSSKKGLGFEICQEDLRGTDIFILESETGIGAIYVSLPVQAAARTEKFKEMFGIELKEEHLRMGIFKLTEQKLMKSFIDHLSKNFDFTEARTPQKMDQILRKLETQQNQVIDPTSSGSSGPKLMLCERIIDFKKEFNAFKRAEEALVVEEKLALYYESLPIENPEKFNLNWNEERTKQKRFLEELSTFSDDVNGLGCEIKEGAAIGTTIFILEGENGIDGIFFAFGNLINLAQLNSELDINTTNFDHYLKRYLLSDSSKISSFITHFLKNYDLTNAWSEKEIERLKLRIETQQKLQQSFKDEENCVEYNTAIFKQQLETLRKQLEKMESDIRHSFAETRNQLKKQLLPLEDPDKKQQTSANPIDPDAQFKADLEIATRKSLQERNQHRASSSSSSSSSSRSIENDEEEDLRRAIALSLEDKPENISDPSSY